MTPARPSETAHNSSMSSSPKSSGGKSPASQRSGRTKTPQLLPHSKYRLPLTEPSFLPVGSSSVTPIQAPMPGISGTRPAYETVPLRASDSGRRRTRVETVRPRCCQRCTCYDVLHLTCWAPSSRGEPARSRHNVLRRWETEQPPDGASRGAVVHRCSRFARLHVVCTPITRAARKSRELR
jgi:hypothetical protein